MITFNKVSDKHIDVVLDGLNVGRIFSPSGSSYEITNAIQICGFEEAFDLWGCGLYGEINGNVKRMKKDIQLIFTPYENAEQKGLLAHMGCERCFSAPCICTGERVVFSQMFGADLPFAVRRESDIKNLIKRSEKSTEIK